MPRHDGILDHKDWDDVRQDWDSKSEDKSDWKPDWKPDWRPAPYRPGHRIVKSLPSILFQASKAWSAPVTKARAPQQRQLRPTAYLDGLRGFAAFLVYWHHHQLWAHTLDQKGMFENGFGYGGRYRFAAFHGVRNFFTGGHFAVAIFFVISGYVLSTKPLSLIHAGEYTKLGDNLASALFRRWLRLYIPLAATTFLYMMTWHAFGRQTLWVYSAEQQSNLRDELWNWYCEFKNFSFVFNSGGAPWFIYNYHSWSIPIEFRGSVVVYTSLLAFSRLSQSARLWYQLGLAFYFLYVADGYYCALFVMGMLLCELDQLAARGALPAWMARLAPYKTFIFYHLFAVSLYLGGVPSLDTDLARVRDTRGWYYFSLLKPQAVFDYKWFYLFWAAVCLVPAVPRIRWLKSFFETRFCQYLGRVSYALYLVHGPVLWIVGDRIYTAVGWHKEPQLANLPGWVDRLPLPMTGVMGLEVSFLVPHLILLPLTLWLADLVTRLFDEPAVRFAQWLYGKALDKPPKA